MPHTTLARAELALPETPHPKGAAAGPTDGILFISPHRKARIVDVVLQTLQQLGNLIGMVHVGFPLADHTVFVDDNCGPFPI